MVVTVTKRGWRRLMDRRLARNVFCPTGPGGGVDPSCSSAGVEGIHADGRLYPERPAGEDWEQYVAKIERGLLFSDRAAVKKKVLAADGSRKFRDVSMMAGIGLVDDSALTERMRDVFHDRSGRRYVKDKGFLKEVPLTERASDVRSVASQVADQQFEQATRFDKPAVELAKVIEGIGVSVRVSVPSDSNSRYVFARLPAGGEFKVRFADHQQPVGFADKLDESGKLILGSYGVVGGYDTSTGQRHSTADVSIDPQSGETIDNALVKLRGVLSLGRPGRTHNQRVVNAGKNGTARRKRRPNPLRIDPSRTAGERRAFIADIRRRFEKLRKAIRQLVVREDEFGLITANVFCPTGPGGGVNPTCSSHETARLEALREVGKFVEANPVSSEMAYVFRIQPKGKSVEQHRSMTSVGELDPRGLHVFGSIEEAIRAPKGWLEEKWRPEIVVLEVPRRSLTDTGDYEGLVTRARDDQIRYRYDLKSFKNLTRNASERLVITQRWKFQSNDIKLEEFRKWLAVQLKLQGLLFRDIKDRENEWWRRYIEQTYRKGQGRAFDDVMKRMKGTRTAEKLDWYEGGREQFVRSTFGRPASVEKVRTLASRDFGDLKGMTDDLQTKLGRALVDGLIQGKHPLEIADDLEDQLGISRNRARTIAKTEIVRAHAEGQLDAMEALGVAEVGVAVEWATAAGAGATEEEMEAAGVCELCADISGIVLKISEAHGLLPRHPG